jgi:hypothetical protein
MPSRSKTHNYLKKKSKKHHNKKTRKHKSKKTRENKCNRRVNQSGGFDNCSLATVQEPGFNIPAIGSVPGFSLLQSKGAIYRPNCKPDVYQAMTP